jgi:isopenicillin N synthase-like dioxygenase
MLRRSPALPSIVYDHGELFYRFISLSHYVTQTVLSCLSDALNLGDAVRLEKSHRDGEPSNTILTLLHYPKITDAASVGHNKHTDIGSLTLLFSDQWGLQVLLPDTTNWTFVQPKAGHAIVNIGDSLRFLSGKRVRSCVHRVVPPGGGCQEESRYSIAYFLRPESTAIFEDPNGNKVSAEKWHDNKYVVYGETHTKQEAGNMLTGGMELV